MPVCEGCGEEFPKGGAYTTHVTHCEQVKEDNEPESGSQEERIQQLESKVDNLEEQLDTQARLFNDELDRHEERLDTTVSTLNEVVKVVEEFQGEFDDFTQVVMGMEKRRLVSDVEQKADREVESFEQLKRWLEVERTGSAKVDEETEQAIEELVADANQETEEASEVN